MLAADCVPRVGQSWECWCDDIDSPVSWLLATLKDLWNFTDSLQAPVLFVWVMESKKKGGPQYNRKDDIMLFKKLENHLERSGSKQLFG